MSGDQVPPKMLQESKKRERSTSLSKRIITNETMENSSPHTMMKQSASNGTLNELESLSPDGTEKSSPICIKSRRTALHIDDRFDQSNAPSVNTSSSTLSSLDPLHNDNLIRDDYDSKRNISETKPILSHEADISSAVNMLRVDSQQSLKQHFHQAILSEATSQIVMNRNDGGTDDNVHNKDKICEIANDTIKPSDPTILSNTKHSNPVSLYTALLRANDVKGNSNAAIVPGLSLPKGFFHEHTPDEIAAYENSDIISAIREENIPLLRKLWKEGHPIQCSNKFGESIVHMVCRRGSIPVLIFLLEEAKVSLRVIDDMGRTPYHDACWSSEPRLELMRVLLKADPSLMRISDKRGHIALDYVNRDHWDIWCHFLIEHRYLLFTKRLGLEKM